MKPGKKIQKKLENRLAGHQKLLDSKDKKLYEGMYTPPGSRNPHKR